MKLIYNHKAIYGTHNRICCMLLLAQ